MIDPGNYTIVPPDSTVNVLKKDAGEKIVSILIVPLAKKAEEVYLQDGDDTPFLLTMETKDPTPTLLTLGIKAKKENGWTVITGKNVLCWVVGE